MQRLDLIISKFIIKFSMLWELLPFGELLANRKYFWSILLFFHHKDIKFLIFVFSYNPFTLLVYSKALSEIIFNSISFVFLLKVHEKQDPRKC